jgi:phage-related protein
MRELPREAQRHAGYQLARVQFGQEPVDWRPMKGVGPGVCEIRIHGAAAYRVLYVTTFPEAVYVLHVFEKRSRRTSRLNLDVARARWRGLVGLRAGRSR